MLRRRKGRFALTASVVFATVAGVTYMLPTRYSSTALIEVSAQTFNPVREADTRPMSSSSEEVESRAAALLSPEIARRVVETLNIGAAPTRPWYLSAPCRLVDMASTLGTAKFADALNCQDVRVATLNERTTAFLADLSAKPVGRSRLIEVSYTAKDPKLAADAVNLLLRLYLEDEHGKQVALLQQTSDWLSSHTNELGSRMATLQKQIEQARAKAGLTRAPQEGHASGVVEQQMASAAAAASQAKERLAAAEARAEALERASHEGAIQGAVRLLDEPVLVSLSQRLADVTARRAEVTQRRGPRHPEVIAIDAQVASLQARLQSEWSKAIQLIRSQVATARAESARLDKNLASLREGMGPIGAQMAPIFALEQELAGTRAVYELFLGRQKELAARSEIAQSGMQILSNANVPDQPSFPAIPRFLAAGLALSLAAGLGAMLLAEQMTKGVTDITSFERELELPLLTTFPMMALPRRDRANAVRYVLERPFSAAAEAIRTLVTSLTLSATQSGGSQSILITSANSEEGKSTLCALLASVAAQSGRRVLVLDADVRRATLHMIFNQPRGPGFSDWLAGHASLDEIIQRGEGNVDVIAAGSLASHCFGQGEFAKVHGLLIDLKQHYDLVVIDTPPLLAMSDALLFSCLADQTIYVCRWQATTRDAVVNCIDRLRLAGANLTGVVLSMVNVKQQALYGGAYGTENVKLLQKYYAE
ncbi:MAG TPA: polysaccharide biosynthesis tyrosine autokinase [Azospirillum sp.]|nr:polysaccharide biosynthesis tyrosine autokinase [Azospirillum sp.]